MIEGRRPNGPGDALIDEEVDLALGDEFILAGKTFTVVGRTRHATWNVATAGIFIVRTEALELFAAGRDVVTAVAVDGDGTLAGLPDGLVVQSRADAFDDLLSRTASAKVSIDAFTVTLWVLAVVIVGALLTLAALERVRDFRDLQGHRCRQCGPRVRPRAASCDRRDDRRPLRDGARLRDETVLSRRALVADRAGGAGHPGGRRHRGALERGRCPSGHPDRPQPGVRVGETVPDLTIDDLTVRFDAGEYSITPLDGFSAHVSDGSLAVLLGPSGCGKTTLLSCLGAILTPTSGSVRWGDTEVTTLAGATLTHYRQQQVGLVFQSFNLVPSLTALGNVAAPLRASGWSAERADARARELLEHVDLGDRMGHRPSRLSGGQQQRVLTRPGTRPRP